MFWVVSRRFGVIFGRFGVVWCVLGCFHGPCVEGPNRLGAKTIRSLYMYKTVTASNIMISESQNVKQN